MDNGQCLSFESLDFENFLIGRLAAWSSVGNIWKARTGRTHWASIYLFLLRRAYYYRSFYYGYDYLEQNRKWIVVR